MICPKCKQEMDGASIHRWHIVTWYCEDCNYEEDEDITGEIIDYIKENNQ